MSDDDKQTIFGFPVASIGFVDKERDAEIASLRAENTVLRDTMVKANELHEKTIAGSAENERAWTAALAEAERERDEARHEVEARDGIYAQAAKTFVKHASDQIEIDRLRAALAEAERERDEARADRNTWALREGSTKALMARKYAATDRQRRTIRALVVAARALRQAGWNWRWRGLTTDFMVIDVRARVAQIRLQEKLNSEQAREANNG